MTALDEYQRLEGTALWRAGANEQRREVVVAIGKATLDIMESSGRLLTHWSLSAVRRANPGRLPAIFHPEGDSDELLVVPESEASLLDGIDRIQRAMRRREPHPGRLRLILALCVAAATVAAAAFWLPAGLREYAVRIVPDVQKAALGRDLLARMERIAGPACAPEGASEILDRLARRVGATRIAVLPGGVARNLGLPGGLVALHREVFEDHDDPSVPAGFAIAAMLGEYQTDPLDSALRTIGLRGTLALLTTGNIPDRQLDSLAESMLLQPGAAPPHEALLEAFADAGLPSTPFALALDLTGESTRALIDGDPVRPGGAFAPALPDSDWSEIQRVCG